MNINLDIALEQFKKRKHESEGKQIDNRTLSAGSYMYYYCRKCGISTEILPETHTSKPCTICEPCEILHKHGLI